MEGLQKEISQGGKGSNVSGGVTEAIKFKAYLVDTKSSCWMGVRKLQKLRLKKQIDRLYFI